MLEVVLDPAKTRWSSIDHAAQLSARYGADRKRRGVKRGIPDIILMAQGRQPVALVIGIELKVGKGSLSPEQKEVRDAWIAMGHQHYVARSLPEVHEILDHCHVPLRRRMTFVGGERESKPALRSAPTRNRRPSNRGRPASPVPVV